MNLNHLHYFHVLAQSEHYTHAANELNITQPSLSHAIHSLEKELGIYLFEKQGRNIKLTKYGKVFYEYVERGLHEIETGEKRMKDLSFQNSGWIDLGFIYTLGSHYVPHLIRDFLAVQENKNIKFNLKQGNTTEILQGLKDEKYDVAFCSFVENQPDINFLPIAQEEVVVIVSLNHPWATKDEIDLRMIEDERIVFYDKESGIRPLIERLFQEANVTPNIICEVEEDSAVIGLVDINYGIALVPDIAMLDHFAVKRLPITYPPHERYIYLATVKNRYLPPSVHTFSNFIIHNTKVQNLHHHK